MFSPGGYTIKRQLVYTTIVQSFCMIVLALLFYSCEQNVNIEIKTNDKRLLVDGEFTTDSVIHTIRLYCSGSAITGRPQTVVTGAKIFVTDNTDTFYYLENKDIPGLYQTSGACCGTGGHNYTLTITNIDIDSNGHIDSYTANGLMPVPVKFDSMVSYYGMNGDRVKGTVITLGYYTTFYNGPNYLFNYVIVNNHNSYTLTDMLGTGELTRFEFTYKTRKVNTPDSVATGNTYYALEPQVINVKYADTINTVAFNFNQYQYDFLKEFDNNTSSDNPFNSENIFDQLKIPTNLPTNIEPSDKAAGYFFIYSISKISNVFNE